MELNIVNDAFRQYAIAELFGTIDNIYIILCNTEESLSTKRSSLPDTVDMEVAIKASEILYLIKQSLLFEQPSGSSEITLSGIPYYAISDITGLEEYSWNSIYLKFESTGDNGEFDTNAISIAINIKDVTGDPQSAAILSASDLASSNFDDSVIIAQSSFPEIAYDTTDKTIETIIEF